MSNKTLSNYVRAGLWALPIYGVANLVSTLSSQPNYHHLKNWPAYARYIHTPGFLASHLGLSILGGGIGLLGFTALFVSLVSSRSPGVPVAAFAATILGSMCTVAVIGVAAFAQPAIGNAFLAGRHDVIALNASVYGTPLNITAAVGILLSFAGAVLFAIAISRSRSLPRPAGILLAVSFPVFAVGSITGTRLDTIAALTQIGSAIWIARSVSRTGSDAWSASLTMEAGLAALDA